MQSDAFAFLNSVIEFLKILISWIPVIGGFLAFIGTILGVIFREWIKNWFAQVAYERKFTGDKAIESHKADETLRVGVINELFRRKLTAHDTIRNAAVEVSDRILGVFAIVRARRCEADLIFSIYSKSPEFSERIITAQDACLKFGTVWQNIRSDIGLEAQNACMSFCVAQSGMIQEGQKGTDYFDEKLTDFKASYDKLEVALKDDLRRIYEGGFDILLKQH